MVGCAATEAVGTDDLEAVGLLDETLGSDIGTEAAHELNAIATMMMGAISLRTNIPPIFLLVSHSIAGSFEVDW
ncbi:hypothetical protein GCM10009596_00120 [Arthrobacter rhombi]